MADPSRLPPHLSDEDIEAYARGTLDGDEQTRVEQHYLACRSCHARLRFLEDVRAALIAGRPVRNGRHAWGMWHALAALAAVAVIVAGVQLARRPAAPPATGAGPVVPETIVRLAPPSRDSVLAVAEIPPDAGVRLVVDATEAGAPGTSFDVRIANGDGRLVFETAAIRSSPTGEIGIRVEGARLAPGDYLLTARAAAGTIEIPFRIRRATGRRHP